MTFSVQQVGNVTKLIIAKSDHVTINALDSEAVEIVLSGNGAFFALKKVLNGHSLNESNTYRKIEVPESYVRPKNTDYLAQLLLETEPPESKSREFLKDIAKKEKSWGLSPGQEKWLRDLAYKKFPDGKLPERKSFGESSSDLDNVEDLPF